VVQSHSPRGLHIVVFVGDVAYNVRMDVAHFFHATLDGGGWYGHSRVKFAGVAVPLIMLEDNSWPFESVILDSMNACRYMRTLLIISRCLLSNMDLALSIRQWLLTQQDLYQPKQCSKSNTNTMGHNATRHESLLRDSW